MDGNMKTILVHCDGAETISHRLAVATDVAQRFDAVLAAIYAKITGGYLTAEWHSHEGHVDSVLVHCSSCADIVVVGQATSDEALAAPDDLPETAAMSAVVQSLWFPTLVPRDQWATP
jgi:hypothetical protein